MQILFSHLVTELDSQSSRSSKDTSFLGFTWAWNTMMTMSHRAKTNISSCAISDKRMNSAEQLSRHKEQKPLQDKWRSSDYETPRWGVLIWNEKQHSGLIKQWLLSSLQQKHIKTHFCFTTVTIPDPVCFHLRNHQISTPDNWGRKEDKKENNRRARWTIAKSHNGVGNCILSHLLLPTLDGRNRVRNLLVNGALEGSNREMHNSWHGRKLQTVGNENYIEPKRKERAAYCVVYRWQWDVEAWKGLLWTNLGW